MDCYNITGNFYTAISFLANLAFKDLLINKTNKNINYERTNYYQQPVGYKFINYKPNSTRYIVDILSLGIQL